MRFLPTTSVLALTAVLALAPATGCATDPTEVMLVVDGEFLAPTEVDRLEITVTAPSPSTETRMVTVPLDGESFPQALGILRGHGGSGDYVAVVTAKLGNTTVISRRARFSFRNDQIRMLRIDLLRACKGVTCLGSDRTCVEMGICDRMDVDTEEWDGLPPTHLDAGMSVGPIVFP